MLAILCDYNISANPLTGTVDIPESMIKVFGKPIIEYNIDLIRRCEIEQIFILGRKNPEFYSEFYLYGKINGVNISYLQYDNVCSLIIKDDVVILPANILTNVDLKSEIIYHNTSGNKTTKIIGADCTCKDNIYIVSKGVLKTYNDIKLIADGLYAESLINTHITDAVFHRINNTNDYFGFHQMVMEKQMDFPLECEETAQGIRISRGAVVCDGAILEPPVFIGENSKVCSGAVVGENSVIMCDCVVCENAQISSSVVCDNSVVTEGCKVTNSVVFDNAFLKSSVNNRCFADVSSGLDFNNGEAIADLKEGYTLGFALKLGYALAKVSPGCRFCVATDGAAPSEIFASCVMSGFLARGGSVHYIKKMFYSEAKFASGYFGFENTIYIYSDSNKVHFAIFNKNGIKISRKDYDLIEYSDLKTDCLRVFGDDIRLYDEIKGFSEIYAKECANSVNNIFKKSLIIECVNSSVCDVVSKICNLLSVPVSFSAISSKPTGSLGVKIDGSGKDFLFFDENGALIIDYNLQIIRYIYEIKNGAEKIYVPDNMLDIIGCIVREYGSDCKIYNSNDSLNPEDFNLCRFEDSLSAIFKILSLTSEPIAVINKQLNDMIK